MKKELFKVFGITFAVIPAMYVVACILDKIMNKYYNVGSVYKHKRILRRKTE